MDFRGSRIRFWAAAWHLQNDVWSIFGCRTYFDDWGHEGQINGWMDGWMDGWMGGWMDGWVDGWMYVLCACNVGMYVCMYVMYVCM